MINGVVVGPSPDLHADEDLPPYLVEPRRASDRSRRRRRDDLPIGYRRPATPADSPRDPGVPFGGQARRAPTDFAHTVPVGRSRIAETIYAWWAAGVEAGVVTVQRRLKLSAPEGDAIIGWAMRGKVRRLTHRRWVPVVVELSPIREHFTKLTMTPQAHVRVSRRYFRIGNSVLDRLSGDLAETSARVGTTSV